MTGVKPEIVSKVFRRSLEVMEIIWNLIFSIRRQSYFETIFVSAFFDLQAGILYLVCLTLLADVYLFQMISKPFLKCILNWSISHVNPSYEAFN